MSNPDFESTAENLADAIGITAEQVKQDIALLRSYRQQKNGTDCIFSDSITETVVNAKTIYSFTNETFLEPGKKLLQVTPTEHSFYANVISIMNDSEDADELQQYTNHDFVRKSTVDSPLAYEMQNIAIVASAIENGYELRTTSGNLSPHFIRRDMNTKRLYMLEVDPDDGTLTYIDLNDVISINNKNKPSEKSSETTDFSKEIVDRVNSIWCFEYEYDEEIQYASPVQVQVRIFDGTGNILEKIKKDLLSRPRATLTGPFPYTSSDAEVHEYYVYEDWIIGLEAFTRWIMKFGRAAIVTSPRELAINIYTKIRESLNQE